MEFMNGIPISWEQELDRSVPMVTQYYAIVRNMYCPGDSRSRLTARTEEELWAKIEEGRRRLLTADVVETGTEQVRDPEAWARAQREGFRIRRTSCRLPPPEDLALISAAKKADPSDPDAIRAIDPDTGRWEETRERLKGILAEKERAYQALQRACQHTP